MAAGNVETSQRLVDVVLGALGVAAASQGTMNNLLFGNESFGYYETIAGGAGAGEGFPGAAGVHTHMTNTRITDPEVLERRYPVRLHQFSLRAGSGGVGSFPGGDGVIRELEFLEEVEVSILSQRRARGPYGAAGGSPGEPGKNLLLRPGAKEWEELPAVTTFSARAGDRLRIETPGGGGWGDPLDRPDEKVRLDVIRDLVSIAKAKKDYGVVLDPETKVVDQSKTKRLRSQMKNERGDTQTFDFGPPLPELLENCEKETGLARPLSPPHPEGWKTASAKRAAA